MNDLRQSKREAKRLLKIAQENGDAITIKNLAASQNIIAQLNGSKNWHDYEKQIHKQEYQYNNLDNIGTDINTPFPVEYFAPFDEMVFSPKQQIPEPKLPLSQKSPAIPDFLTSDGTFATKDYSFNQQNTAVFATIGSGKTEVLRSLSIKLHTNQNFVIYADGKGDTILYTKFFATFYENQNLENFYCLNFMSQKRETNSKKNTNSIDPINNLSYQTLSTYLGDTKFSQLVLAFIKELHEKKLAISAKNLKSLLSINQIKHIASDVFFSEPTRVLCQQYLVDINSAYDNDIFDHHSLALHNEQCQHLIDKIRVLNDYEERGAFSTTPDTNISQIIHKRQFLLVLFPALEKPPVEFFELTHIFNMNLEESLKQIREDEFAGWCIFDEAAFLFKKNNSMIVNNERSKWRFVLGFSETESGTEELIFKCEDYIFMKNNDAILKNWCCQIYKDLCHTLDFKEAEKILSPSKAKLHLLKAGDCYYYRTKGGKASGKADLIKGTTQYLKWKSPKEVFLPN